MIEENTATASPKILFEDDHLLVLFKPSGWFVHPPEDPRHRRGLRRKTCVQWLMDVHQIKASPAHRLDAGTEGVIVFGKSKEALQNLNQQFNSNQVEKTYHAIVRGWFQDSSGKINLPLKLDSTEKLVESLTYYFTVAQIEKDFSPSPKFTTSRYSLLEVKPHTGRFHQIRRHMNHVAHPIIGDSQHGDLRHNKLFREQLNVNGLCLRASKICFRHPKQLNRVEFQTLETEKWNKVKAIFNLSMDSF